MSFRCHCHCRCFNTENEKKKKTFFFLCRCRGWLVRQCCLALSDDADVHHLCQHSTDTIFDRSIQFFVFTFCHSSAVHAHIHKHFSGGATACQKQRAKKVKAYTSELRSVWSFIMKMNSKHFFHVVDALLSCLKFLYVGFCGIDDGSPFFFYATCERELLNE